MSIPANERFSKSLLGYHVAHMLKRIVVAAVLASCCALAVHGEEAPEYSFYPWPFGAIVWIGDTTDGCPEYAEAAAETVARVFEVWELEVPVAMANWQTPTSLGEANELTPVDSKVDPSTGETWYLTALRWQKRPVFPLLLVVFPNHEMLADALGSAEPAGAFAGTGQEWPDAKGWFMLLSDAPCCVAVSREDTSRGGRTAQFTLAHELAHWMTHLYCLKIDLDRRSIPLFLVEGIAEYTAWEIEGYDAWRDEARAWAEENTLDSKVAGFAAYYVGGSVIDYALTLESPPSFLSRLKFYAGNPDYFLQQIESGWRSHLGLPDV